jgi:hypothetical protein
MTAAEVKATNNNICHPELVEGQRLGALLARWGARIFVAPRLPSAEG